MRGWWPDEKLESGLWSSFIYKPVYNYFKKQEKKYFETADYAISLTHAGKSEIVRQKLKDDSKVAVIPTCVNFNVFTPFDSEKRSALRKELSIPEDALVMLYSGSVGTNYRTDLMLKFFKELKKQSKNSILFFLSHSNHQLIKEEIAKAGVAIEDCRIKSVRYQQVSENLMVGDIGLIMYDVGFSVIGRSPTKLGEYWASGLTCLSAKKIGDLESIVDRYPNSGVLINSLEDEGEFKRGVDEVLALETNKEKLRDYAVDYFALEEGCKSYLGVYQKLVE